MNNSFANTFKFDIHLLLFFSFFLNLFLNIIMLPLPYLLHLHLLHCPLKSLQHPNYSSMLHNGGVSASPVKFKTIVMVM